MIVHFVCSGNTFRSRLAEAYLKSLHIPSVEVISSGARAMNDKQHQIMPSTVLLLKKYGIASYASKHKTLLTQARIDMSDVVICVNRAVYHQCLEAGINLPSHTYIWDVADINHYSAAEQDMLDHGEIPKNAQETFQKIKQHVNEFVAFLKKSKSTERLDVLDDKGQLTGETSDITTVHSQGLIHGGVHVGLYTRGGGVVLQRRSSNIIFNPGQWDLSMGGVMASGETPEKALLREVHEELGISLDIAHVQKLFVWEYNYHLPHYGFHTHCFTHTYIARIPERVKFTVQASEVAEARIFSIEQVRVMNENNKSTGGNIIPTHAYNQRILEAIQMALA